METRRFFAADLGASGGKCFAGIFDDGAFRMEEIHRFDHEGVSFYLPDRGGKVEERCVWDDVFIYRNIVDGLHAFRRNVADAVDGVGVDTWGADGHFFSADGDVLGRIYCYRDHRLDNMVEVVKARVEPRRMYELTGIHFQPFNVSNQLHWFVTNRRELLLPGSFFLPIPSVFNFYLCGAREVDSSWASVTQLMDARRGAWSEELLKALDIPSAVMPKIVPPGTELGRLHRELSDEVGLNPARVIAVASHDTASAFASAPVEDPAEALIVSSGTWSLVGKLVPEPITSDEAMAANISNEGGIGNVRFLKNCMGTWLVQELRRAWARADGREMDWSEIVRLAQQAPAFSAFIDPDDQGFYNPSDMEAAIVSYCRRTKQAPPTDRGAMLRVVYESLALKYRVVNEQICGASGTRSSVVNIVGGGSKNELLNAFTANALGLPVLAGPEEATAVGNLMVQALGAGIIANMAGAQAIIKGAFPIRRYEPQDREAWEGAWETFNRVVSVG